MQSCYNIDFTKSLLHVSVHEVPSSGSQLQNTSNMVYNVMSKYIMVNHQCVIYTVE